MRDILPILERWTGEGQAVAVGSVIERIGSAPRDPGAALAVSTSGEVAGSVTGGCVEPAVIREATEVLKGSTGRICRYGLTDDDGSRVAGRSRLRSTHSIRASSRRSARLSRAIPRWR